METFSLCRRIADAVTVKRWATTIGRSKGHLYTWVRDPADPESKPNLFDWVEATILLLGSRPEWVPVLVEVEHWFTALCERAKRGIGEKPSTPAQRGEDVVAFHRAAADFLEQLTPASADPDRLRAEGAELIALVQQIMRRTASPSEAR